MVETIFLDWMLSLGAGLLFGKLGIVSLRPGRSRFASAGFRFGVAVQLLLMAVSVALYALSAEWMWMYWVDPAGLPVGIVVLAFAMYALAFLAGYLVAPELERLRMGLSWWAIGAVAGGVTLLEILAWDRLTALGSLAEFASGDAPGLGGAFLVVLALGGAVVIGVALWLALAVRRAVPPPETAS